MSSLKTFNIIGPCPYEVFEKGTCLTVMVTSALAGIPYSIGRWAKEEIWEVDFIYLLICLFKHPWEGISMSRSKSSGHQKTFTQTPWELSRARRVWV